MKKRGKRRVSDEAGVRVRLLPADRFINMVAQTCATLRSVIGVRRWAITTFNGPPSVYAFAFAVATAVVCFAHI